MVANSIYPFPLSCWLSHPREHRADDEPDHDCKTVLTVHSYLSPMWATTTMIASAISTIADACALASVDSPALTDTPLDCTGITPCAIVPAPADAIGF
jgi:hypothetical protein